MVPGQGLPGAPAQGALSSQSVEIDFGRFLQLKDAEFIHQRRDCLSNPRRAEPICVGLDHWQDRHTGALRISRTFALIRSRSIVTVTYGLITTRPFNLAFCAAVQSCGTFLIRLAVSIKLPARLSALIHQSRISMASYTRTEDEIHIRLVDRWKHRPRSLWRADSPQVVAGRDLRC